MDEVQERTSGCCKRSIISWSRKGVSHKRKMKFWLLLQNFVNYGRDLPEKSKQFFFHTKFKVNSEYYGKFLVCECLQKQL